MDRINRIYRMINGIGDGMLHGIGLRLNLAESKVEVRRKTRFLPEDVEP